MFTLDLSVVKQFPYFPMSNTDGRTYCCCHHSPCSVNNCDSLLQNCIIVRFLVLYISHALIFSRYKFLFINIKQCCYFI